MTKLFLDIDDPYANNTMYNDIVLGGYIPTQIEPFHVTKDMGRWA